MTDERRVNLFSLKEDSIERAIPEDGQEACVVLLTNGKYVTVLLQQIVDKWVFLHNQQLAMEKEPDA